MDDQANAVVLLAVKQIAGHQAQRLGCDAFAVMVTRINVIRQLKLIEIIDSLKELDMAEYFPRVIDDDQHPLVTAPEAGLRKTAAENWLRHNADRIVIAPVGDVLVKLVQPIQIAFAHRPQADDISSQHLHPSSTGQPINPFIMNAIGHQWYTTTVVNDGD